MPRVAIALGSNLGDRRGHLDYAAARLNAILTLTRVSTFIETEPVDVVGDQPAFLNGALVGEFRGTAHELLDRLLAIERERGRVRPHPGAARTLDLDLVLFGDLILDDVDLTVPHARFRSRRFVLEPLAEVAGEWVDPATGLTVEELLARLRSVDSR